MQRRRDKEIAAARQWQAAHPERTRINRNRAHRVYYRLRKLAREAERFNQMEVSA